MNTLPLTCSAVNARAVEADRITPELQAYAFDYGISFIELDDDFYLVRRQESNPFCLTEQELLRLISAQPDLHTQRTQVRIANNHARRRGLLANLTLREWLSTLSHFHDACVYCGELANLTLDHFIPMALSGPSTIWNCLPACEPCNLRKAGSHPDDYPMHPSKRAVIHAYIDPLIPQGEYGYACP